MIIPAVYPGSATQFQELMNSKLMKTEKKQKCRWCEGGACDLVITHNGVPAAISADVDAADGMLCVHIGDIIVASRKVNYCPMCGKRVGVGK